MSKLPYWVYPSFWGLSGKTKERALAEYNLTGYELDFKLLEIDFEPETKEYKQKRLVLLKKYKKISEIDFELEMLNLDHYNHETNDYRYNRLYILKQHNMISEEEYEFGILDVMDKYSEEYKRKKLNLELQYNIITEQQHKREMSTLDGEEYFEILRGEWDPEQGMIFEFDWNSVFLDNLRENGFRGETDSDLVNSWFDDVCRQVYKQSLGEEDEMETSDVILSHQGNRIKLDDNSGIAEYF